MQYSFAALALAAAVSALPAPQAATGAPSDCVATYPGSFEIEVVNTTDSNARRGLGKRQGPLVLTLADGVLKDSQGRIGNIVANNQFQFDPAPGQAGAIYTSGWAVCPDGTLVLGKDSVFQQCLSGTFYNLYDENPAAQCNSVHIYVLGASTSGAASQSADGQPVQSQQGDGQVTGTPAANPPVQQIGDGQAQAVTQIGDGQIQAPTGSPLVQISDGQVQQISSSQPVVSQSSDGQPIEPTSAPVGEISDGQPQVSTQATAAPISQISDGQVQAAPVTQIGDGQVQAPTGSPISQISDGQIQAPTGVVTQIGDGQVQAPTGSPVSQISDGQIQAPTGVVTQIGDGQIQAPTGAPVTQIGDGQIQAPTNGSVATPTPSVVPYTGAANTLRGSAFGLAAAVVAVALL